MAAIAQLDLVSSDDLQEIIDWRDPPIASFYFPNRRDVVNPHENSLHLRSALGEVESQLAERGLRTPDIRDFLDPLRRLVDDGDFWLHQLEGVAVFRTSDSLRTFRLPYEVPQITLVQDEPHLRYLFPALFPRGTFYVLAVSTNSARLLECTRLSAREVDLARFGIPTSLERALRYDDLQKPELQHHPTTGPGRSPEGQSASENAPQQRRHMFHGHGESGEGEKTRLRRYFQALDDGIRHVLPASAPPPLILAGVDHVQALYREVSGYQNLVEEPVTGSHDRLDPDRIHELARPVIEGRLQRDLEAARERYSQAVAENLASTEPAEILAAAHDGRVDTLFVRWDDQIWGRFDPETRRLATQTRTFSDVEVLDQASRLTFQNSGEVYVLRAEDMVADAPAAAMFRY